MKFFKRHMKESIFLMVFLVIILICLIAFLVMWFGVNGDRYGTRLDGIKEVPLSDSYLKDITDEVKDESIVSKATVDVKGRLVNFIITINSGTALDDSKKLSTIVEDNFTEDELSFYDIQIFIVESGSSEDSKYPIIGYKHKTSDDFVWSNTK